MILLFVTIFINMTHSGNNIDQAGKVQSNLHNNIIYFAHIEILAIFASFNVNLILNL